MRALSVVLLGAALSGCFVELEGAPCTNDANCPLNQWCTSAGTCREALPTAAEACEQVVRIGTRRAAVCYGGAEQSWLDNVPQAQLCLSVLHSLDDGHIRFDAAKIRQCKEAIANKDCKELSVPDLLKGCQMFAANTALGAACETSYDCAAGWCKVGSSCPGTCTNFIADDAACTNADKCTPGAACANGSCRRYAALNAPCSGNFPCEPYAAYCDGATGTCQAKRTSGACFIGQCQWNYTCSPPLGGGSCGDALDISAACTPGNYQCDYLSHCSNTNGTCKPLSRTGDGCGFNFEGEISGCIGARCVGSTCANFVPFFGACGGSTDCGFLAHCGNPGSGGNVCIPDFCAPP